MQTFDQVFALLKLLQSARYPVSLERIRDALDMGDGPCSRATANRALFRARYYLGIEIDYVRDRGDGSGGYQIKREQDGTDPEDMPEAIPGLWLNSSEIMAILTMNQLLTNVQPGFLEQEVAILSKRIEKILESRELGSGQLAQRVRLLSMAGRAVPEMIFRKSADALVQRRRLKISYEGRGRDELTRRTVSPQRLIHYRDNWYLDAWCHKSRGLRTFAVERIREAEIADEKAIDVPGVKLDRYYTKSFGIFGGKPTHTAVLRFTAERARWVADERWHPDQEGQFDKDGSYELYVPYKHAEELMMDILKYGPDVEVLKPAALRRAVAKRLTEAGATYAT
jgi:predicted DNA-binding transcriptional regulator YafY